MSMRTISKKALAIVLSVAMLFSCMVFSFSASAAETLMWENSFDNGTSSNWKMQYDGTASNHTSFHSDPSAATHGNYATLENGAMKLGFGTNESAESYLSAFNVMHQDTTHTNAGQYGWVDEYPGSLKAIGNFRPSDGKYKVTFDYTVTSFNQNSASKVALYVGYGETFWDGNRNLTYITNGGGAYKQVLTVDHSDIAAGKQLAEVTLDVATTKTPYIFLFARVEDNTSADLTNAEIVVDNVKIYSVTADPVVPPSVLKYENAFDNGTATNWMDKYSNANSALVSNSSNTKAIYDATTKSMKIELTKAGRIAGFRMQHKDAADDQYGAFTLKKGYYKVEFDYQLTAIASRAGATLDVCVGVAKKGTWYWETSDKILSNFTGSTAVGIYGVGATLTKADEGAAVKKATVYLDITSDTTEYRMHVFTKAGNGYQDELNSTVFVDNVKIYEVDKSALSTVKFHYNGSEVGSVSGVAGDAFVLPTMTGVPAECEYFSDEACTQQIELPTALTAGVTNIYIKEKQKSPVTLKYENAFDNGTATNWMDKYSNPNSALVSNSSNTKAIYDATTKSMKIELTKAGRIAGFRMQHKDAADDQYGAFTLKKGYYKVEFDYQLTAIASRAGATLDVCVGVAKKGTWYWETSDKILSNFTGSTAVGIYGVGATLTKADEGAAVKKATVYLDITSDTTEYRMHVFTKAGNGYQDELNSTVFVDNVKIYEVDKSALSTVTFYYNGNKVGETNGIAGEAFTMPTLTGAPNKCDYFSDAECTQKIDLPTAFTAGTTAIYIKAKDPIELIYENAFDNGTADNWMAQYSNPDAAVVANGPNTKAIYDATTKSMKIDLNHAGRIAGFRMHHQNPVELANGVFTLNKGYYKIEFDYRLESIIDNDKAAVDVCVGVAKKDTWYWENTDKTLISGGFTQGAREGIYRVGGTLTKADEGAAMKHATVNLPITEAMGARRMHIFTKSGNGYGDDLTSTVFVDNVKIYRVDESLLSTVTFYYGNKVAGETIGVIGDMFEVPELTDVPEEREYYADADYKQKIDLPAFYPEASMPIYVKPIKDASATWSFEDEANNSKLSLNTRPENTIFTDNSQWNTGIASARVNSDAANGFKNLYPQMLVKNGLGEQVFLEKGKNYEIKFWVYQPAANGNYELDYWFAVSGNDDVYDAEDDGSHSRVYGLVAEGTFTPTATDAWQEITIAVTECSYGGKLRLGIIGDKDAAHPFYIDDITITEMSSETNVWSFDKETVGTLLDINTSDPGRTITVDDTVKYSGYNSARFNGNTKLNDYFPQMMVKNDAGKQIYVYEGRNYEVKFRLFKPASQPEYGFNYWLAATTEDVDKEFNRTDEGPDAYRANTYKLADYASVKYAAGEWVEVVIPINNCKRTGKLRLGISGDYNSAHMFYIDDVVVNEFFLEPDTRMDSYERYEPEQELALNTDGTSMKVMDEDRRSGDYAVKVVTTGNDIKSAAQMLVTNFRREPIKVEKGKDYRVSFWVERDGINADYDIQYWFAVGDEETAFTTAIKNVVVETQTLDVEKSYVWYRVKATISDCPYTGTLRLGITGTSDEAHTLYIDDMYAYEDTAGDPDPKAMNFEMYDVGTNLALNQYMPQSDYYKWTENTITVTDAESYTGGQSVFVHCNNNMQNNRPHMLVRDGSGNVIRVKKGDDFFVSFMMYVDPAAPYFSFGYWLTATPEEYDNTPFFGELSSNPEFSSPDYLLPGDKFEIMPPDAGAWTEIKIAVMDCPYEGSLRIGLCHGNAHPYESSFYIDDIKVYDPEYVTVKFETNGSQDTYEDITLMSDMLIPMDNYIDPYREGYEFLGWYTSPTFEKESFFEIYSTPVVGKTGDVITLYARWREWSENIASTDRPKEEQKFETKLEYYTEEVWVDNLNQSENPYPTEGSPLKDAAPIVTTPDPIEDDSAMPPWLLVVIIVAAVVVVGGGSTLAAILLKKSKKA